MKGSFNQLRNLAAIALMERDRSEGTEDFMTINDFLRYKLRLFPSHSLSFAKSASDELEALKNEGAIQMQEYDAGIAFGTEDEDTEGPAEYVTATGKDLMAQMFEFVLKHGLVDLASAIDLLRIARWFFPEREHDVVRARMRVIAEQVKAMVTAMDIPTERERFKEPLKRFLANKHEDFWPTDILKLAQSGIESVAYMESLILRQMLDCGSVGTNAIVGMIENCATGEKVGKADNLARRGKESRGPKVSGPGDVTVTAEEPEDYLARLDKEGADFAGSEWTSDGSGKNDTAGDAQKGGKSDGLDRRGRKSDRKPGKK